MIDNKSDLIQFERSMWIVTWVTLILPPVTGIFMLSFVGVFPFPEVFYPFTDFAAVVVVFCTFAGLRLRKYFVHSMLQLVAEPNNAIANNKSLKRLPLYYFGALFFYFTLGLITTLLSLSFLHGFDYSLSKYFISMLGIIPGGLITAMPIFFYLTDSIGRFLAPRGVLVMVAPVRLKLLVLGLFVPVLIDTLLIMFYYDRTGYFQYDTIGIWFFLILIAGIGTALAWQSFRLSLSPFINALEKETGENKSVQIIPQSLDELGLLSKRWQNLWLRVLDYEKQIVDSNILLRGDVESRTRELESEKVFINNVLENAAALVMVLDKTGKIIRFNPACEKITGFRFSELYDCPIWEWLIPPEQLKDVEQVFNRLLHDGFSSQYENEILRKDGGRVLVNWNNSSIRDNNDEIQYVVSVGIDMSEREAALQAVQNAKENAERASRAKTQFLSQMSHELRTPMNAILGFAQLLELDKNLNRNQHESVAEILQAGRHLLNLINEVLDLSRIEAGKLEVKREEILIYPAVADVLQLIKPQAEKNNIELINKIADDNKDCVRADQMRLKQVLINILSNAIKYNRDNGTVIVNLVKTDAGRIQIAVEDTGNGIAEDQLEKLFMPFERLGLENSAIEGTGIGLALSKHILELMDGSIKVDSTVGRGSIFCIELPAVD